jgi:predicted enzyme related to lactoylglutathione lyase
MGRRGNSNWGKPMPFGPVVPTVTSFEDAVKKIKAAGGQVIGPKMTVPKVGYMTYCKDTEGNIFGIMQTDLQAK